MKSLTLLSFAKLNLYLEVLDKRSDDYHNIITLFERIGLADKIILRSRQDKKIKILCNSRDVPKDQANFAYKAAKILQDAFRSDKGVDIHILKRIPVGSGLGGGSSNAASVLLGLNKLWRLGLSQDKLAAFSRKIGADAAFFIYNSAFAIGKERGDRIKPLKLQEVKPLWHILVVPRLKVSTPDIYKKWDKLRNFGLTKPRHNVKILLSALKKNNFSLLPEALFNGLEQATVREYPEVGRIKAALARLGLKSILMSGSGPAVFGICSSRKEATSIGKRIRQANRFWRVFVTRTV